MSLAIAVRTAFYIILRFLAKIVFKIFYRDHGVFHPENFPPDDGTPILFIAAPHGNFLMDAITIFVTCPRYVYFLSARSNFDYPIFGTLMTFIGCIPVTRPFDVKRVDGDGLVRVIEDGKIVIGNDLGNILKVRDTLYVEFEEPDHETLKEASGIVEEIINDDKVRIKEPGMKWTTKGKPKGQLKRLVEYGSFVIRVDRESTINNLEKFLPKYLTKSIDRLSTSPGVLTSPVFDGQPNDIIIHSSNQETTEHTPLIPESSSSSRRSSYIHSVPDIPTTYSYTRMPPHSEVYSAVHSHFSKSNCIAIFPEGTSHDNEHMLSLKYGCAVMSLGYLASNEPDASGKPRKLKLVPCGLNFFDRHSFRSRVFVEIGPTIEIDNELIEMYKAGDESKRKASQQLLNTIHTSLTEITINAPDYETLLFFKTASKLYREKLSPQKFNFSDKIYLLRRIAKKYSSTVPLTEEVKILKWDTNTYAHKLRKHHLSLPHLSVIPISLILYLPLYLFLIVLTIPGLIFFCPIGLIAQYVGKKQGENTMLYDENSLSVTRWPGMRWVGKRTWVCLWSLAKLNRRRYFMLQKELLSTRVWKWLDDNNN
ncbi:18713_t:CDS:2 [Dentiscutata erythropus]|uniref:18713_t:CDS:1 n=2 Tax=Dentiscutata TaxID=756610 RepID=A0A9N8ZWV5_9GLOM|nr:18713_t:CDS:2 [Dentiscutata erythropus]